MIQVPYIFGLLSIIFGMLAARDYLTAGKLVLAAKIRLRLAIIFALVAGLLLLI